MEMLVSELEKAEYCVVFTGAGVSTLSGIRDFRGKNGLYSSKDADKIFDFSWFRKDPSFYYKGTKDLIYNLEDKTPSIVHTEIARLEKLGIVKALITQNIDLLHQKGGSGGVIEVHGSPLFHSCLSCGRSISYEDVCRIVAGDEVPRCESCGGVIKPGITFFGEALPEKALRSAVEESSKADLMLVLGSTLLVQPAASFPLYTLRNGGKIIIVNNMKTPLDEYAALKYSNLEEVFRFLSENESLKKYSP